MTLVDTTSICDNENGSIFKYECGICGLDVEESCTCIWDTSIEYIDVYCHDCETYHKNIYVDELIEHNYYDDDDDDYYWDPSRSSFVDANEGDDTRIGDISYRLVHRCRHYNVPLEFPDGTTVYASSEHSREKHEEIPDFGLYLDNLWEPECMAYVIEWPDMGLPKSRDVAAKTIIDTYLKAMNGLWVEIGCIGGHGRTGTVLACMAVLSGLSTEDAISYVKTNYCSSAIETDRQEWFVEWFWAYINGGVTSGEPLYDKDKGWIEGPKYSFDGPFYWKEYSIFDNAQGKPSEQFCKTALDEYAVKSWDTVSAGKKTAIIYPDEDEWNDVTEWMLAKYKEMYPDDNQTVLFEDIEDVEEVEAFAEEMETEFSEGPIWAQEIF